MSGGTAGTAFDCGIAIFGGKGALLDETGGREVGGSTERGMDGLVHGAGNGAQELGCPAPIPPILLRLWS